LNQFEQQTNVPKVYVVLGLGALYFFLIFFNIGGEFLVNTAGFLIPAYYSLAALFSSTKADDTQVSLSIAVELHPLLSRDILTHFPVVDRMFAILHPSRTASHLNHEYANCSNPSIG
jgi:hypothetical protein